MRSWNLNLFEITNEEEEFYLYQSRARNPDDIRAFKVVAPEFTQVYDIEYEAMQKYSEIERVVEFEFVK